jgi:hypothetical protein
MAAPNSAMRMFAAIRALHAGDLLKETALLGVAAEGRENFYNAVVARANLYQHLSLFIQGVSADPLQLADVIFAQVDLKRVSVDVAASVTELISACDNFDAQAAFIETWLIEEPGERRAFLAGIDAVLLSVLLTVASNLKLNVDQLFESLESDATPSRSGNSPAHWPRTLEKPA